MKQATPHEQLIGELLDSTIPKTEREHAAAREIERLQELLAAHPFDRFIMQNLSDIVRQLEDKHGGLRSAGRATGIDAGYLKRLRDGEKTNPSDATLAKLGLRKEVIYVLQRK